MIVPEGWKKATGEEIAVKITKGASPKWQGFEYQNSGTLFVTSENVRDGYLDISTPKFLPIEFTQKMKNSRLKAGDILINIVGASIGRSCIYTANNQFANINQAVCLFRLQKGYHVDFFSFYLQLPSTIRVLLGVQSASARPNLSLTDIRNCLFMFPERKEQKAIADIISTWDRAIEKTEALIEAKERRKKGLMQKLLTGRVRFGEKWEFPRAEDLFKNISAKGFPDEPVLSVTQDQGVVFRDDLERKINMSKGNTHTYKLVEPGDFVISLRSFQGGLEHSDLRGTVSPAYHVIRHKRPIVDAFYKHYFKSYDFIGRLAVAVIGIRDGKQISYTDFSFMRLPYPPIELQKKIASILDKADKEIKLEQDNLAALKEQKKGLMQQLLTGKVRVKPKQINTKLM